jgi:beta-1,4-N-acetylglucosaminyltransferase
MAPAPAQLYTYSFLLALLATLLVAASLRLLAILPSTRTHPPQQRPRTAPARLLVVLGSGGHTHEMLALLRELDALKYARRTWVVSSGDNFSASRAVAYERGLEERFKKEQEGRGKEEARARGRARAPSLTSVAEKRAFDAHAHAHADLNGNKGACVGPEAYTLATIPRARRIHQPLYTVPLSALRTLLAALAPLLAPTPPALILTNGPATGVLVVLAAFILRFFDVRGVESKGLCRCVYVESFARVKTLSLSGRLLVRVVDRFVVQWEELEGYGGRAEYAGILVS